MLDNIPEILKNKLINQYGEETYKEIIEGYKAKRKVTIRVNEIKSNEKEIEETLNKENIIFSKPIWNKNAFILDNVREDKIENLSIYKEGKIYMQSLSSMIPPIVLEPKNNTDILDMAAAPGGKTTQIASIVNNNARITACEFNNIRAERLKYNIQKQGAKSVYVMKTDSRNLDDFFSFDSILLDAPCSGSGTLKICDNQDNAYLTEKLINKCIKTQKALLKKAIKILKPGSEMVYSTCSILKDENEDIINKFIQTNQIQIVPINIQNNNDIPVLKSSINGTLLVKPSELYEGFFIAKIRKIK